MGFLGEVSNPAMDILIKYRNQLKINQEIREHWTWRYYSIQTEKLTQNPHSLLQKIVKEYQTYQWVGLSSI